MNYYIYGYTDTGSVRDHNEDAFLIDHEVVTGGSYDAAVTAPLITAVCDGVGGENAGELAAQVCLGHLSVLDYSSGLDMKQALMSIHGKIKRRSTYADNASNMQTTLCALCIDEEGRALCVNVGDSRMYRYVGGKIRQITVDQSYVQFLYDHGEIDSIKELDPQVRKAIVSSLGSVQNEPTIAQTPLVNEFGAEPDDMLIIVSDGVSDCVSHEEFEIGLSMDLPISEKLQAIAKLAILNGSRDNVTIVGVKPYIDEEELEALTVQGELEETVNINDMLAEVDPLSDILTIDVQDIIGHGKEEPQREAVSKESLLEHETQDLWAQAQASLSMLSSLFKDTDDE